MGAKPGEEDVGLFVAQEVLDGEDGGEVRGHDREHNRSRREGRDTGPPACEVLRHRRERDRQVRED